MKIVIGSLKFSPIFKSHCLALGRQCEKKGFEVIYIFSKHYRWLLPKDVISKTVFFDTSIGLSNLVYDYVHINNNERIKNLFAMNELLCIYMFNYHPLNHKIAHMSKKLHIKYIQHIHETSVDPTNYKFGSGHLVRFFYEKLINKLIENTDMIIVSSKKVYDSFNEINSNFSGVVKCVPLIYLDSNIPTEFNDYKYTRKYITFVGPPIPTKNVELFYKLVRYSIKNNLNINYLLITRKKTKIAEDLLSKLEVYYKNNITDEEIEELIQKSIATIAPYTNISQSSNVLTSYKLGTPVIASNIPGLRQFVFPKKTGCLIDLNSPIENWMNSLSYVSNNIDDLSKNCTEYYKKNFSESTWDKYLDDILYK
jgi:glycosyltransferase involved in cell wall biosynthesis